MSQAVGLLAQNGDRAKILAGGQSLIPLLKLRLGSPELLVDIGRVPGLSSIEEEGDHLIIGALVRHRDLERSPLLVHRYPLLADVPKVLGDPQVRNLGTIGGSLAHADPAGDWGTALLAFDATLVAEGPQGPRSIPVDGFFQDTFSTVLGPSEILTQIRVPAPPPRSGGAYRKLKRKTGDFAIVSVSAQLSLDPQGTIASARVGLGAVAATPIRARQAEAALLGQNPGDAAFEEAGRLASQESSPSSDIHGSASYRRAMVRVLTRRALETAAERSRE